MYVDPLAHVTSHICVYNKPHTCTSTCFYDKPHAFRFTCCYIKPFTYTFPVSTTSLYTPRPTCFFKTSLIHAFVFRTGDSHDIHLCLYQATYPRMIHLHVLVQVKQNIVTLFPTKYSKYKYLFFSYSLTWLHCTN